MERNVGLLLAISSLPNKYGVGDFSSCKEIIKILSKTNFNIWQILPLNPIGYGHSPYQPFSSFAIDEMYIDVEDLYKRKLIKKPRHKLANAHHTNFEKARNLKKIYIFEAYKNIKYNKALYKRYKSLIDKNSELYKYATYMAYKENNDGLAWDNWTENYDSNLSNLIETYYFAQLILLEQWNKVKKFASLHKISIIGDVPFYVGYDSSDVLFNKDLFLLDQDNKPTLIAGVPPDYFSKTGQRWGNPIYNWNVLENTHYDFLIKRLEYASSLYDIVRLDHFRAFDSYWGINPACETAIDGQWYYPKGYDFFNELYAKLPHIRLIAEDLGDLRHEVLDLKNAYHLPGMMVLQFSIINDLLTNQEINTNNVYYTGTHDNDTLQGYVSKLSYKDKKFLEQKLKLLGYSNSSLGESLLYYALHRPEQLIIIPAQDVLLLNSKSRMNIPSIINEVNWTFRLTNLNRLKSRLLQLKKEIIHV